VPEHEQSDPPVFSFWLTFLARLGGVIAGLVSLNAALKWSDSTQSHIAAGIALVAAALAFGLAALARTGK
jgi:hypothetical protein